MVAVEPDRDNFAILQKNTAGYASIAVFEAAIWSSDTQVELEDPGMDQHAFNPLKPRPAALESLEDTHIRDAGQPRELGAN